MKDNPYAIRDYISKIISDWICDTQTPLDIALADVFNGDNVRRVKKWTDRFLDSGARRIIICDTRGTAKLEEVEKIFKELSDYEGRIEFHPHDDDSLGVQKSILAYTLGATHIGTAIYRSGERRSMLDPRELYPFTRVIPSEFLEFERMYREQIGNPCEVLEEVFGDSIIITGSQWKLRGRDAALNPTFGATTNTDLMEQILGRTISAKELSELKDCMLYGQKIISIPTEQIKKEVGKHK